MFLRQSSRTGTIAIPAAMSRPITAFRIRIPKKFEASRFFPGPALVFGFRPCAVPLTIAIETRCVWGGPEELRAQLQLGGNRNNRIMMKDRHTSKKAEEKKATVRLLNSLAVRMMMLDQY